MLEATIKLKPWKHQGWFIFLKFYGLVLLIKSWSNIVCQKYWSSQKICFELKVWIFSFLNIRSSRLEESCKKCILKINSFQNSLKNIHDAVFNLIKFQLYWNFNIIGLQLYWKRLQHRWTCNFIEKRLQHRWACNFIKKRLQHSCFLVNIAKYLWAASFIEHLWWLLLKIWVYSITQGLLQLLFTFFDR